MSPSILAPLASLNGVRLRSGASLGLLEGLESALGSPIPIDHRNALAETNGAEVYGGYLTLFGVGSDANVDVTVWNDPKCWKFSWEFRCCDYWCFAETAWGDQYAYNIPALINGEFQVYLLDCLSMTPTPVARDFSQFLEKEFFCCAKDPYDVMIKEARQVLGDLEIGKHLVYVPSPLLGGREEIANVRKMDARSAMICNGDIASQLDAGPADGNVKAVVPYEDSEGRMRLELTWA
jgi:hypothetical protein